MADGVFMGLCRANYLSPVNKKQFFKINLPCFCFPGAANLPMRERYC